MTSRLKMHEAAELLGGMGSWEWGVESDELVWSDNLFRIFGLSPSEADPTLEFIIGHAHPEDRERLREEFEHLRTDGDLRPFEFRMTRPDGEVRSLLWTIIQIESEPRRLIGYTQDVTEQRRAEREIQAHTAVAEAMGSWESFERSGEGLLQALGEAMEFSWGAIWLPDEEGLVANPFWQATPTDGQELEALARDRRIPRGHGLPGQVWESGRPVAADDKHAVAFPALEDDEVLAVVEFHSREDFATSDRLMESFIGIGHELGHVLARRRRELLPVALTPRELEVLQLAARGRSAPDIAEDLVVSRDTVKTHLKHIYTKLEVGDRAAAVAEGLRRGLID